MGGISIFDMREIGDCYSNILLNINSHRSTVTSLFYDGYRLISGGYDQKVIGWDTDLNEKNFVIKPGNKGTIYDQLFFIDFKYFLKLSKRLVFLTILVNCMWFDGTRLAIGLDSKKLGWYDFSKSPVKQYTSLRSLCEKNLKNL